ncbi:MAG: sulfotransferase [Pseudomonadota bacterium]
MTRLDLSNKTAEQWFDEGNEHQRIGNLSGALDAYRTSLKVNPAAAGPWLGLADILDKNQQPADALACLQQAVTILPNSVELLTRLARTHQNLGQTDAALAAYEKARDHSPDSAEVLAGLGELFEDLGAPEQAAAHYREILKSQPNHTQALANIVGLERHLDVYPEMELAKAAFKTASVRDRALIGYGLGKALDRAGRYDEAFEILAGANAARRELAGAFGKDEFDRRVDKFCETFSASFFGQRLSWGNPSGRPVFIVGLPRSGTTLTEQIISSHPIGFGAGELGTLSDLATAAPDRLGRNDTAYPKCADDLSRDQMMALGSEYVAHIESLAQSHAASIVDKQPLNFWHLGLVAVALPNAKIIHCVRDIRDVGNSIFSQNFNPSQKWSTDLKDIAHYWRGYRRLMRHYTAVTKLDILEVRYEDTVTDIEQQSRRVLDFLGLNWDPKVLSFHKNQRAVQTPSRWQVRQPIYASSKEKWRLYEKHLGPLVEAASEATE